MSVNCKNLIAGLFLCFSLAFVSNGLAQEQLIVKPDFGQGSLEEASTKMEKLLELKWDGDNLALSRDWEERSKKKKKEKATDENDELEEMVEQLIDRGIPEAHAERLAEQMLGKKNPFGGMRAFGMGGDENQPAVEKAFFAIPTKFGGSSSGSSGMNERRRLSFSNRALSGVAFLSNDDVRFEFTENDGDERSFEIRDNGKGKVKFEFSYDELFMRLIQSEKGKTQLIWISSDKADVFVGDSFSEFVQRNPQVAEKLLFPLFDRLGIKMPVSKTDPRVIAAVIKRLELMAEPDEKKLAQLIKDLDSDSYQIRKDASKSLNDGFEQWSVLIKKYSVDTTLSPEARVRLKEIIDEQSESEIAILIDNLGLLESPEFLIGALEQANDAQKASMARQLEKITEQSYGTDLDAWKNWLKTNTKQK